MFFSKILKKYSKPSFVHVRKANAMGGEIRKFLGAGHTELESKTLR